MASDEPPYLNVGTEVSARYKGAFCEAKVKKVNRLVKCKVNFKGPLGNSLVTCDLIKGSLSVGATVEAKHNDTGQFHEAIITKLHDYSQYTVVFDDGDVTTLRRTSLCLKSGKHFAESETLDQLPLTNPEHFGTPVVGLKSKRKRRSMYSLDDKSSDEEAPSPKAKKDSPLKEKKYLLKELEADLGRVVCVDYGDKRKKDSWFPGLVVSPAVQENVKINHKEDFLIRSFKDGKYYTVCKKDVKNFRKDLINKVEGAPLKIAMEKANQFIDNAELPAHWDRNTLLSIEGETQDDQSDTDTESSDDEPTEDKDRFIAQLYNFMDERSTPINRAPSIGSRDLNLYKLFKIVQKLGGCNRVTNQTRWKSVYMKMGLPSPNLTGILLLKQAYRKYLQSFEEIHKKLGYTMVGKESTRSGRSARNMRPTSFRAIKKENEDKKETTTEADCSTKNIVASTPPTLEDPTETEMRRTPRNKVKEEKEDAPTTRKIKVEVLPKKETRNSSSNVNLDKSKEEKPTVRSRSKRDDSEKLSYQKNTEPPSVKNQQRKNKSDESHLTNDEAHIKNGPVQIGDRVKVKYGNREQQKIYEAKVREISKQEKRKNFLVHYTGWNMRYDEWVNCCHIVECIHEKSDAKQQKKKTMTKAAEPKTVKRCLKPNQNVLPSKSPKTKPVGSPSTKASKPAAGSCSKSGSSSSNGRSPYRSASVASSTTEDDAPSVGGRLSRATRSEKKVTKAANNQSLEPRTRSRKASGALVQPDVPQNQNSSEEEEEEPEAEQEPFLRSRRRKDSESSRRSASVEPMKKAIRRTSVTKKVDQAEIKPNKQLSSESSVNKGSQEESDQSTQGIKYEEATTALPVVEDEPTDAKEDSVVEKEVDVPEETSSPPIENIEPTVKDKDFVAEDAVKIEEAKPCLSSTEKSVIIDIPEEIMDEDIGNVEENSIDSNLYSKVIVQSSESELATAEATDEVEKESVHTENDGSQAEVKIEPVKAQVESEHSEPMKKVESSKEFLKVEGTAIVEDAFRKMAANLKKNLIVETPRVEVSASKVQTVDELPKSQASSTEVKSVEVKVEESAKEEDSSSDNSSMLELDSASIESSIKDQDVLFGKDNKQPDLGDSQDEEVVDISKDDQIYGAVKQKKKKPKDADQDVKSKKTKKKEKKMRNESDESVKGELSRKKDKRKSKKADESLEVDNLSFLADLTIGSPMEKEKKKSKKSEKKLKKRKGKDGKGYDSDCDKKAHKGKKKKGKTKIPEEDIFSEPVPQERDQSNINLLCDEDVLPASPAPISDSGTSSKSVSGYDMYSVGSNLAALAPTLAAELQHPSSLTTQNSTFMKSEPHSSDLFSQTKNYEPPGEASQMLVDNTPPTTPESSISTTSVISSPSHERETMDDGSATQEENANFSPHSAQDSSVGILETKDCEKFVIESTDKEAMKKRKKGKRSRSISESSKVGKLKVSTAKDSDSSTGTGEIKDKSQGNVFQYPKQPPKSSKFNFYVPLDEYTDGAQRIELLQEKMCELREKYMALKAEVAQIDRRRKRARKKEREGGSSS